MSNWWPIVNSVLSTLFTGVLAYLAYRQWKAMHSQAEYMRDGLKATDTQIGIIKDQLGVMRMQAQALINIERARVNAELIRNEGGWHDLSVRNDGRSAAYLDWYSLAHHWFDKLPLPDDFREREYSQTRVWLARMIGPGEKLVLTRPRFDMDIQRMLNPEERAGRKQAIFRGGVVYRDVFMPDGTEQRHETELVYRYELESGALVNMPQYTIYT